MPRQLALVLCGVFVFYLLKWDRQKSGAVSWALWIPTLWILCVASRSLDTWLGVEGGDREAGGVIDPLFQTGLLCAGLIVTARRRLNWSSVVRNNVWLAALIGWMLVSILWSDMPLRSFRSWIKEGIAIVMALVIFTEAAPQEACRSVIRRTTCILIPFSVLLVKYYPYLGAVYNRHSDRVQWIGVTLQKNSLGHLCFISIFFLVWTFVKRWNGRDRPVRMYEAAAEILLLLMTLWLLRGPSMWAASATAMFALSGGLIAFFTLLWTKKHRIRLGAMTWGAITGCIVAFGIITPLVGGSTVTSFTSAVGRDTTLTGRTEIWAGLLPDLKNQPILGYGFSGFWTNARIREHEIQQAHNGYLDMWLQLGFAGLLLTAVFLISCAIRAHKILERDFDYGCLYLCFALMIVIDTIADSSLDSFTRPLMAILLFLSFSAGTASKRRRADEYILASAGTGEFGARQTFQRGGIR